MNAYSIIIIIIIALLAIAAFISTIRNRNKCSGCCENCAMKCGEEGKRRKAQKKTINKKTGDER